MNKEKPLVVLQLSRRLFLVFLFFLISAAIFFVLGLIIPVFSFVNNRTNNNMEFFLIASGLILALPYSAPVRNAGIIYFYDDWLEIVSFLGLRKRIFFYDEMRVTLKCSSFVVITRQRLPCWSHPWQRFKTQYWEGLGFCLHSPLFGNSYLANLQKALKILQQRAGEYRETSATLF